MEQMFPAEIQAQLAQAQQREKLAQLLIQQSLQNAQQPTQFTPGKYGRAVQANPLAAAVGVGTMINANQGMNEAAAQQGQILGDFENQTQDELRQLHTGGKDRLTQFLASKNPRVRLAAEMLRKEQEERDKWLLEKVGDAAKDRGDTQGSIGLYTGQIAPTNYQPAPFDEPQVKPLTVNGKEFVETRNFDKYGRPTTSVTAGPSNVSVNTAGKLNFEQTKQDLEATQPGKGELWNQAKQSSKALTRISQAVGEIENGAQTGLLEPLVQPLRGLGEYFGIENAATAPTAALSATLKARVLDEQGGLGAQISDADRKFFVEAAGDLSTNPDALLRLLAIAAAMSTNQVTSLNQYLEGMKGETDLRPGQLDMRRVPLNFTIPEGATGQRFEKMYENVLLGRPTTYGIEARPSVPAQQTPLPGGPTGPAPAGPLMTLPPGVRRVN
jgi:hypothetical protein